MSRRRRGRRNVYLGTDPRVPDINKPGLDSLTEVGRICEAIIEDYQSGKISKKTASGRFARLHNTIIPRDSDFKGEKRRRALKIVEKYWDML